MSVAHLSRKCATRPLWAAAGPSTQRDPIGLAGGINQYGYAGGDPVNFSDPFGLCPDDKNPACKRGGGVLTMSLSGAAGFGAVGAHFNFGLAVNRSGDLMLFAQAGPSIAVGVSVGVEGGGQDGSFNDLVSATDAKPSVSATVAAPTTPSVTVSGSGVTVGGRGGAVAAVNITNSAAGSGTINIGQSMRDAKAAATKFIADGLTAAQCAAGYCPR